MNELERIKKKCEKAWLDHENAILSWDEAAGNIAVFTDEINLVTPSFLPLTDPKLEEDK